MAEPFQSDDIAIVGMSCILPDAYDPLKFWENLINEKSAIRKISEDRLKSFILDQIEDSRLNIISRLAAEISLSDYRELILDVKEPAHRINRLRNYALVAARRLMSDVGVPARGRKQDIILGCMNADNSFELQFLQSREKAHRDLLLNLFKDDPAEYKTIIELVMEESLTQYSSRHTPDPGHYFTTSILSDMAREHGFVGEQFLVDTACASSITAIDLASQRLKLGECDFAISGGMESNLGQATYVIFSSVGALAPVRSAPFDKNSEGLAQSEGAVFFALKRLEDAVQDGNQIHGVIRGIAGSSDGRSASLFQPNVDGQKLVYQKVHGKKKKLHYLEAHGTGTQVGDDTEMKSISNFFSGEKIPVGSVKALLGHTKGAAGASGLLKCLLVMKNRLVTPSSYVKESLFSGENSPYVNILPVTLPAHVPLRAGVNSFGFGGTNYHLLVEEWTKQATIEKAELCENVEVGIVAESSMKLDGFNREDFFRYDCPFKLPPKSAAAIDKAQLIALITTWQCIKELGAQWDWIPKENINVVSACTLGLDQVFELADRMMFEIIVRYAESSYKDHPLTKKLRHFVNEDIEKRYAPINEDAATGILNNVLAGRVSNAFDLFGKSYNIDKDIASVPVTMEIVRNELRLNPEQIFVVIGVEETLSADGYRTERHAVTTRIVTSKKYAEMNELDLRSVYS